MSDFDGHEFELSGTGIELRAAGGDDEDLIRRIVTLATHWDTDHVPHEVPETVEKYYTGWGRPGDIGVLSFQGTEFAGGAFVRRFGPVDGAYGYIAEDYPELGIGIEAGFRRRGIAVLLLAALKAKVIEKGLTGISLSVSPENHARNLYSKMGFDLIEDRGHDLLMLWRR